MKKTLDIKKLILLNMPYILLGLFATNFGEAWRMAQGADASEKFLSLVAVLPGALQSFWPSLHPLDLLVGLCCGVGLRLAVYLKSKNAKKYRHGLEYGSARWGTREDIAPYVDPVFQNNVILTKTESLTMNSRPKDPKTARNKNVLVIGAESLSSLVDWKDRSTCILFGDGAGAVVVKAEEKGYCHMAAHSDGTKGEALVGSTKSFLKMNGQEVFKFAVRKVPELILALTGEAGIRPEEIDHIVLHQANQRIIEAVARRLNLKDSKFPVNLDKYANTSAASIPVLLDEMNLMKILKQGQSMLLAGFGAGLTWAGCLFEW